MPDNILSCTVAAFAPDQPILGLILCVYGDEIDSRHAYDAQITSTTDYFIDLVKSQAAYIGPSPLPQFYIRRINLRHSYSSTHIRAYLYIKIPSSSSSIPSIAYSRSV
jgi:hypothetical protein